MQRITDQTANFCMTLAVAAAPSRPKLSFQLGSKRCWHQSYNMRCEVLPLVLGLALRLLLLRLWLVLARLALLVE